MREFSERRPELEIGMTFMFSPEVVKVERRSDFFRENLHYLDAQGSR
jgi:hypothetical protein